MKTKIPYVFANVATSDPIVPTVSIDYVKAGYEITKKLIEKAVRIFTYYQQLEDIA